MGNGKSAAAHRHGRRLCDHAELATDRWRRCGELLSGTMRNPNPNPNPNANPNPNQVQCGSVRYWGLLVLQVLLATAFALGVRAVLICRHERKVGTTHTSKQ